MKIKRLNAILAGLILTVSCLISVANAGLISSSFSANIDKAVGYTGSIYAYAEAGTKMIGVKGSCTAIQGCGANMSATSTVTYRVNIDILNFDAFQ